MKWKNFEEMAKEGFYLVKSILRHCYCPVRRFLTLWEGYGVDEATWESCSALLLPDGRLNFIVVEYLSQSNLGELLRLPLYPMCVPCPPLEGLPVTALLPPLSIQAQARGFPRFTH